MFISKVCAALKKAQVHFAIVGGYAVALHGAVRGTIDVDIAVEWSLENLQKTELALKEIGLISRLPIDADHVFHFRREYIEKRNLIDWNFYDPLQPFNQVDLIITYNLKASTVKTVKTAFGNIPILSKRALIAMKKASGRPQDLEDVKSLENL